MKNPSDYSAKDIKVLTGLDPVRLRPGMFVGGSGSVAWHHMIFQLLDGIFEQALLGNGNTVSVTVKQSRCLITATLNFSRQSHLRHDSLCTRKDLFRESNTLHLGSWTSVVRALSSEFSIRVVDEVGKKELTFFNNTNEDEGRWRIYDDKNFPRFEVEFSPDFNILGAPSKPMWKKALIKERLLIMCGIKEGFCADFHFENTSPESIQMPNGLAGLLIQQVPGIENPARFHGTQGNLSYQVAMAPSHQHQYISYANTVHTRRGGDHVRAIIKSCKNAGLNAEDYAFFISVFLPHPKFAQPVKDELISQEIRSFIIGDLTTKLKKSYFK